MEQITPSDIVRACKQRAVELQDLAKAAGGSLKRGHALDQAAREIGYRDWNAANAMGKAALAQSRTSVLPSWQEQDRPLPNLPLRIHQAGSAFYRSIRELMRWARAVEGISGLESDDARSEMFVNLGGDLPYVFNCDHGRWNDDVFRLCDRGYEEWPGIAFNRDELRAAGIFEWHKQYGGHDGEDMLTVLGDDIRGTSRIEVLKGLARTLAAMALVADQAFVRQQGTELPKGRGFTIDLNDPSELNAESVSRLLGSRDDSRHRQLRVSAGGIAYLSDRSSASGPV